jgi:hypothetical protein
LQNRLNLQISEYFKKTTLQIETYANEAYTELSPLLHAPGLEVRTMYEEKLQFLIYSSIFLLIFSLKSKLLTTLLIKPSTWLVITFFSNFKNLIMKKIQSFKNHNKKIDFNTESKNCLKKKAIIIDTNIVINYLIVFILLLNPIIPYIILVECPISTISTILNSLAMELRINSLP